MEERKILLIVFALFVCMLSLAHAQYYDIALVRANDSTVYSLVYDDMSFSYVDRSWENPDVLLRICSDSSANLLNKYISLAYADGVDGDYIEVTQGPVRITSVTPSGCAYPQIEIFSFRAWYPSIPYVLISDTPNMSNAARFKLSRIRGWFIGNYTVERTQVGNQVIINVTNAIDDTGASIVPDVNYLVVGLVRDDFTVMDTGITSPNDPIVLFADSPTSPYHIFINGIGPDMPPYVEIITPEPITYTSGSIPFTYIMFDDDDITSCWYVLDGVRVDMPACGPAYILNVGSGSHSLTLYANDTTGNVGSDSVNFKVEGIAPPVRPPGGGGPPGTPIYQPIVPPPPPGVYFSVIPENIYIIIDYPKEGSANFSVTSTAPLTELNCVVRGDFENYTTVELYGSSLAANGTVSGRITVSMPPIDILDYNKSTEGVLQCTGKTAPTLTSSALANVYLIINKPLFDVENKTVDMILGTEKNESMVIWNVGAGNSTAINVSVEFERYQFLFSDLQVTKMIENGKSGYAIFVIKIPSDFVPGTYLIPLHAYENGRLLGTGYLTLRIEAPTVPGLICVMPDLTWTLVILLLGLGTSSVVFRRKARIEEFKRISAATIRTERRKVSEWEKYKTPFMRALMVGTIFFIVWLLLILILAKCTYVRADSAACVTVDPIWTAVILLLGLFAAVVIYRLKKEEHDIVPSRTEEEEDERRKIRLVYALATLGVFLAAWLITFIFLFPKCA
ncbi:MAG: hypothetical protein QW171_00150 [Candidatus Bilamarchaeaceae archaeon]